MLQSAYNSTTAMSKGKSSFFSVNIRPTFKSKHPSVIAQIINARRSRASHYDDDAVVDMETNQCSVRADDMNDAHTLQHTARALQVSLLCSRTLLLLRSSSHLNCKAGWGYSLVKGTVTQ